MRNGINWWNICGLGTFARSIRVVFLPEAFIANGSSVTVKDYVLSAIVVLANTTDIWCR
jgi:hypothetical protein